MQLRSLAPTTQHLIFLSAIPVVYPGLGVLETLLVSFEGVRKGGTTEALLFKTGAPRPSMYALGGSSLSGPTKRRCAHTVHRTEMGRGAV